MSTRQYTGILDLGTPEQKEKLFRIEELVSAPAAVALTETTPDRWRTWPRRDQDGQSSCVFHSRAKLAGILREKKTGEFVEYSAADYNKRSTAPLPGAYPIEAMDMLRKEGIGLEVLEPSTKKTEAQLAATKQGAFAKEVARVSLLDGYYALPRANFDMIVSTLHATGKPVIIGIFGSYSDWKRDVPVVGDPSLTVAEAPVRHAVCATPNYGIYKGEEGFTIEDSWGTTGINGLGVRWITRSFFEQRNYIAGLVPTTFKTYEDMGVQPVKPKCHLDRELQYGSVGADVHALQNVLRYEGYFPANHSGSTYFGNLTQLSVQAFQRAHDIVQSGTPATTGYGRVGPQTLAAINKIYG